MFAVVMTFDEVAEDTEAGIEHVRDEVVPALLARWPWLRPPSRPAWLTHLTYAPRER